MFVDHTLIRILLVTEEGRQIGLRLMREGDVSLDRTKNANLERLVTGLGREALGPVFDVVPRLASSDIQEQEDLVVRCVDQISAMQMLVDLLNFSFELAFFPRRNECRCCHSLKNHRGAISN